ncbi:MAG: mycofactocin-coupled SDR family oxidoreductase [Nocardioidaceae bacterium]
MTDAPRVALVTGAARGIGAAVVRRLLARGYVVHALDSCAGDAAGTTYPLATRTDLDTVVALDPSRVLPVLADVRDAQALEAIAADVVARSGSLDVVVAGAAVMAGGAPLWETTPEDLALLWETDALGVWNTAHACVPHLLTSQQDPVFVGVASAAGDRGLWHLAAYCMAKHAVIGIVRGLAADLKGTGVTACAVSPGSTDTAMLAATAAVYDVDVATLAESQAAGRPLEPDEVAAVVEFGCTAGTVVHGSVLRADGGFA